MNEVRFIYKNYKGVVAVRDAIIKRFWYGETPHHSPQWIMDAHDKYKGERSFAVLDCDFRMVQPTLQDGAEKVLLDLYRRAHRYIIEGERELAIKTSDLAGKLEALYPEATEALKLRYPRK